MSEAEQKSLLSCNLGSFRWLMLPLIGIWSHFRIWSLEESKKLIKISSAKPQTQYFYELLAHRQDIYSDTAEIMAKR